MLQSSFSDQILWISGDKDGPDAASEGQEFLGQIAAIAVGQDHVGEQQVHLLRMSAKGLCGFGCVSRRQYTVSRRPKDFASYLTNKLLILRQQDG